MRCADVLVDAFGRVRDEVGTVLAGLSEADLAERLAGRANSIGWLVWHLARVEDDHVAHAAGVEQVWTSSGFVDLFGLPLGADDIGYGHNDEQVSAVRVPSAELLVAYYATVHARTVEFLGGLVDADLDRVVDSSYDPPVTLGVRLVSVLADISQHAGQAAFVRGLLTSRQVAADGISA